MPITLNDLEKTVKEQKTEIENLQNDRIALDSTIVDQDTSIIISGMNARIKALETKIIDLDSRKDYE